MNNSLWYQEVLSTNDTMLDVMVMVASWSTNPQD